jgi:adenylate cyclase class 2
LEHEVKLRFDTVEAARHAVEAAGGQLVVARRLLVDMLFDTPGQQLRVARSGLRVRRDRDRAFLTFKGPVQPGPVKSREEIEVPVGDAEQMHRVLHSLGFEPWFRSEKYREEYRLGNALVTVDEAPIGVFVEIEAAPDEIDRAAARLGCTPKDYRLESYVRLYFSWCEARGRVPGHMVFE